MTVRGIEAIKLYLPATNAKIDTNIREEQEKQQPVQKGNAMTSVERYRQEWTKLLEDLDNHFENIRDVAFNGDLKVSKFRSVHWAILLRVLNADYRTWYNQRTQQRKRYENLKLEFAKNPHEVDASDDDPLSQSKQSIWNQYFSDQELFAVIKQDVIRTFPGVDFFRKPIIQSSMSNILFYYAREHPYMCYRQGMHEILAPILFVMYSDHQSLLHFKEISKSEIETTLLSALNPDYLEADSYSIFSRLMSSIESYYRITNLGDGYFALHPESPHSNAVSEVEVIGQLNSIRDKILAKEDQHLHNHLMKLDIPLHIFGIRWLRLLFGREFPLLDLLVLWDAIFADSDRFDLPNYILVAMLIRIREKLLLNDYTTCLTFLMRYPPNLDINLILRHSLHMLMPKKFDCPPNAFVYFTMNPAALNNNKLAEMLPVQTKSAQLTNSASKQSEKPVVGHNLDTALLLRHQRARSTSLCSGDRGAHIEQQINFMQARNAEDSAAMARIRAAPETDRVIMDGYAQNSPELMRLELQNAQTVINVARNKLQRYLATVRHHVSKNNSENLAQALDGIEELCCFLDVKFMFPIHARAAPIDQALEAAESQRQRTNTTRETHAENKLKVSGLDEMAAQLDDEFTPATTVINATGSTYEKPDNGFMRRSYRVLGNLREIELIPITSDEKIVQPEFPVETRTTGLPIVDPLGQHKE